MANDPTDPEAPTEVLRASGVATPPAESDAPAPHDTADRAASAASAAPTEPPAPSDEPGTAEPDPAPTGARARFARAAAGARTRASNADVKDLADTTSRLIDNARPFFLAFAAACFAVLGFFEGDSGTSQLFVFGSLLCVVGAAFSSEINAFIADRAHDPKGKG